MAPSANLTHTAMGITHIYPASLSSPDIVVAVHLDTSYYSVSLALNILLTLMIITRLALHNRNIRSVMGTSGEHTRLYTAIVTMLVESYALHAIAFLFYIVPWALQNEIAFVTGRVAANVQVRATAPLSEAPPTQNVVD